MIRKLFTWPFEAIIKLGEKIQEEAERELYDLRSIQRQLLELEMMYEAGDITEEHYQQKEEELLERYQIAKEREQSEWHQSEGE